MLKILTKLIARSLGDFDELVGCGVPACHRLYYGDLLLDAPGGGEAHHQAVVKASLS